MYLNRKKVFNLLKTYINQNNKHYDIIFSYRNDLFLNNEINILEHLYLIKSNHILIPEGNDFRDGINDQIAIGNYETMEIYLSLYDYIIEILDKGVLLHPENILRYYLHNLKNQKITRFNLSYEIKRF
jgi:hypothetical protein